MATRECPFCHRLHEVADDGTISTWLVTWKGQEAPTVKEVHYLSDVRRQRLEELRKKYGREVSQTEEEYPKGFISNRKTCFIHHEDAVGEYTWIKNILVERGDWDMQKSHITITEGERKSWYDLFESPDANWQG